MKSLVEGECGRSNALVGLARDYGQSNQRLAPATTKGTSSLLPSNSLGEQFASDFLQQKSKGTIAPSTINLNSLAANLPQNSSSSSLAGSWSNEFATRQPHQSLPNQWASQYALQNSMNDSWKNIANHVGAVQSHIDQSSTSSSMWSAEFLSNIDSSIEQSRMEETANEWSSEFLSDHPDAWRNMEFEWDAIQRNAELAQNGEEVLWDSVYSHQDNNPFLTETNPLSLGDNFSSAGDLGNAVLAYEAAVQRDPNNSQAWCKLGLANAENEEDTKAIEAFRKCLKIEPANGEALLGISVSLANESMSNEALKYLDTWLTAYEGNAVNQLEIKHTFYSLLDSSEFQKVEQRFLASARLQKGQPDAALQNAFGVLYNLNTNYERAIECLKIAVQCRPEDPLLWNRLGATLANSQNSVEAIAAYRQSLKLYPNYVRARYNLAISCMQLKSYKEAADHLVSALELQHKSDGAAIWTLLRSAVNRIQTYSPELMDALDKRNLGDFKKALNLVSLQKNHNYA